MSLDATMRGVLCATLAILLLFVDYWVAPALVEDHRVEEHLSANRLANGEAVAVGTYRLNRIVVSSGNLADDNYLRRLHPIDGLAITAFSPDASGQVGIGSLANAVRGRLGSKDARALEALLSDTPRLAPGKVQVLRLLEPLGGEATAGLKVLIVMRARRGGDEAAKASLRAGLKRVLEQAEQHSVSTLLLPTLTVAPGEDTPSFADFFNDLFEAMRETRTPRRLDVSFFDKWPINAVEEATAAFNEKWEAEMESVGGILASFHRAQFRLLLVGLAICFLVSSQHMTLGFRSSTVLATAYTMTFLGASKTIEAVMSGFGRGAVVVVLSAAMLVLAGLFPQIVTWSVKDLFAKGDKDAGN